jgi:coenzyme F420-dependent glucose-6-phosphate dehydrogenase
MGETKYWFAGSTEEFGPGDLVEQAKAAEKAGFDGLGISDHWGPWFPDGKGTQAWVTLGAIGQQTSKPIGTGVTAVVHRYHPAIIAQSFMTLEALYP